MKTLFPKLLGWLICMAMYPIQFAAAFMIEKDTTMLSKKLKNRLIDFVPNVLALVATLATFRGYWSLIDLFVFPNQYNVSLATCLIVGCLLLMVLSATNNLHAGVSKADIDDPKSQLFDVYYSTYFYLKVNNYVGFTGFL